MLRVLWMVHAISNLRLPEVEVQAGLAFSWKEPLGATGSVSFSGSVSFGGQVGHCLALTCKREATEENTSGSFCASE